MRALPFFKLSPGGNTTILVPDTGLSVAQHPLVAEEILRAGHLEAEQAGFIDLAQRRLRMAGGEFCVNATRAFGLVLALESGLPLSSPQEARWRGTAYTSGMEQPVALEAVCTARGHTVSLDLDLPETPPCHALAPGFTLVRLPGISHLLIDAAHMPFPPDWREASAILRQRYGLNDCEAAGCVWWRRQQGIVVANPVVAVKHPRTVCHESACGSGALALALALSRDAEIAPGIETALDIMQPSGLPLHVALAPQPSGVRVRIGGAVRLVAQGTMYVDGLA